MALIDFFKWSKECQKKPENVAGKGWKNVEKKRKVSYLLFLFVTDGIFRLLSFLQLFGKEFGKFDQTSPFDQCFIQLFQTLTVMKITLPGRNVWRSKAALAFKKSLMRLTLDKMYVYQARTNLLISHTLDKFSKPQWRAREKVRKWQKGWERVRESPALNGRLDSKAPTVKSEYRRPRADWIGMGMNFDLSPPKCRQRLEHLSLPHK